MKVLIIEDDFIVQPGISGKGFHQYPDIAQTNSRTVGIIQAVGTPAIEIAIPLH